MTSERDRLAAADKDVSLVHDFLYGRGGTMDEAHAACWRIHDILRPMIADVAPAAVVDVEALRKALEALFAFSYKRWLLASPDRWPGAIEMWVKTREALTALPSPAPALPLDADGERRLAEAIERHDHAIGWDRMCTGADCAAAIVRALRGDEA